MKRHELRLARPVYEALPWLYVAIGAAALGASYAQESGLLSLTFGLPGLLVLLAGIVVLLRRRDYRQMRARYERPDALVDSGREADREPR